MSGQLLIEYLESRGAKFHSYPHEVAYTAAEIAERSHIQGGRFAKVVMIKADAELAMMVIPAHYYVDLDGLGYELAVDEVVLACEKEFSRRFPRCEIGAMPPFGHLYGLQTFLANIFPEDEDIAFNAGNHSEIITMPLSEYLRLAGVTLVYKGVIPPQFAAIKPQRYSAPQKIALVN